MQKPEAASNEIRLKIKINIGEEPEHLHGSDSKEPEEACALHQRIYNSGEEYEILTGIGIGIAENCESSEGSRPGCSMVCVWWSE